MYTILLVDDEASIREVYKEFLEDNHLTVMTVENPRDGIKFLADEHGPVIIISDIKFPGGESGYEFIRKVKKTHPTHEIIIISGHADIDLAIEAIHLDASDFIPKPCKMDLLLLAIKRAAQKIEMRQTIKKYTESLEHMVKERAQEIKRMEAQLIQSAKLSAMGELAASICHELRQPLCGVMGFSYLIERELSENSPAKSYVHKLDEQCERMKEIIENLRSFSRQTEDPHFEPLNVKDPIESALSLFTQQLKNHNIRLKKFIPDSLPPILGNKTKLQQVLVNLISNARDALNAQTKQKEKNLTIRCEQDDKNKNIVVHISDNGIGIDQNIQARIFDSFFTTKSVEQGTGLGLSIARTIIADHNGQINLLSKPGEGASFTICFPIYTLGSKNILTPI